MTGLWSSDLVTIVYSWQSHHATTPRNFHSCDISETPTRRVGAVAAAPQPHLNCRRDRVFALRPPRRCRIWRAACVVRGRSASDTEAKEDHRVQNKITPPD